MGLTAALDPPEGRDLAAAGDESGRCPPQMRILGLFRLSYAAKATVLGVPVPSPKYLWRQGEGSHQVVG